jgi:hypothetical protein
MPSLTEEPEFRCTVCGRIVPHYYHQRCMPDGTAACCLCFWQAGHSDRDPAEEDAA